MNATFCLSPCSAPADQICPPCPRQIIKWQEVSP
jgi:hypothetical protein